MHVSMWLSMCHGSYSTNAKYALPYALPQYSTVHEYSCVPVHGIPILRQPSSAGGRAQHPRPNGDASREIDLN